MLFTEDWFSNNIPVWSKELSHLKHKKINILEIGTYEGRSAIWMLENILTHPDSKIYCVDIWSTKKIYKTFLKNIEPWKHKVIILKGYSNKLVRNLNCDKLDFIYIDGSHHSQNVLEDAVLSFPLLKKNGLLIFDDYTHNKEHDINCPKPGIDAFINIYANQLQVLQSKWQVIIKKRSIPIKNRPCYSEHFKEPNTIPQVYK
jgi:predicted O-methyltransferase YrrM